MARKKATSRRKRKIRHAEIVGRFAESLRRLRRSRGLSQADLAAKAQVSLPYIGRLERGRGAPGIDLLDRLAAALGTSAAELLPAVTRDPEPIVRTEVRRLFESVMERADRETLLTLAPWLALVNDALSRRR